MTKAKVKVASTKISVNALLNKTILFKNNK